MGFQPDVPLGPWMREDQPPLLLPKSVLGGELEQADYIY